MITNSTLIDNSNEQLKMVSVINDLLATSECNTVKIATGYWDIPGMALILPVLSSFLPKENAKLQLLIGTDPIVRANQLKRPLHKDAQFPQDFIKRDIQELEVKDEYVAIVQLIKNYCLENESDSKLQIRLCKTDADGDAQFFHAKCYIFLGKNFAKGIIGSSNFTRKGLEDNAELNYLEWNNAKITAVPNDYSATKGHNYWFDEKWEQSSPWNKFFLEQVLKDSPVGKKATQQSEETPLTPYELYIKLLNYKFGEIVDLNQQQLIESYLPQQFNPLDYQIQAVKQCFAIMREHGGFMLADVVGLGKTIVGTLIIKHFLTLPEDDGRERNVLVITPPAIQSAWKDTIKKFDADTANKIEPLIDFATTGSINKLVDDVVLSGDDDAEDTGEFASNLDYKNYGLIIIDESHKFRNSQTAMYKALDNLIGQIGSTSGAYPFVGLLSATPQNNRPADIQNQLYLFERNHADSTLKKANGGNLEGYFADINRRYASLITMPKDEDGNIIELAVEEKRIRNNELKELSLSIRNCILEDILVRRTRTDIIKHYANSGLTFPKISGPHSLEYKMEDGLAKLFADTMNLIAPSINFTFDNSDYLCYYRYRAIEFLVDPNTKELYKGGNIDPDRFSRQLARIMQINLVKRIESSFSAFKSSLSNLRKYTQNMINMWEANTIFICPDINVNAELDPEKRFEKTHHLCTFEECMEDIRNKIKFLDKKGKNDKGRNRELIRADFDAGYIKLLRRDLQLIEFLCKRWNAYSSDPKLEEFKRSLVSTLFDKQRNEAQKLVIFSEAIDTVDAIKLAVEVVAPQFKVLAITAANRDEMETIIKENFDANYDGEWKNDYQVIVTTEVLAEGVNLHRANCILNYDTPWNSTRLMQRIGRVNRIGSTSPFVYVYNFMPSAQGDAQIQLVQKAYTKLQSFHTLFGEDAQVFSEEEEVMHYDLNTQVNGEESPMEKYISELKTYKMIHPKRFAQIAAKEEGLEMALATQEDKSYFLVRNQKIAGMFVCVDKEFKAHILSGADMYRNFRPEEDSIAVPLPNNWKEWKAKAELTVNQALTRMNIHIKNSEKATRAKAIITRMKDELNLSLQSRSILADAFKFVNKGNFDIIKKIIAIDDQLIKGEHSLFHMTQQEVDEILCREIKQIVSQVQERYGKAQVYMALSK